MSRTTRRQDPTRPSLAADIERRLALEIIRGERAPGSRLPPVRDLAKALGVTAPTIQRAVDRLAAGGLVSARRGSGVTVNDPRRSGDLSMLPLWFEALADRPALAAEVLTDFLTLRRVVTAHLVRSAAPRIIAAAPRLAAQLQAVEAAQSLDALAEADATFTGLVVEAAGQFAVSAIFHTTGKIVREVPHLAEALYADRTYHRAVLRRTVRALAGATPDEAASAVEAALAAWDRRTVARFRAHLEAVTPAARR
ncbi:MAG: FadR family transcriptional regulator [Deltaproteobacteria bacterium]|nr:FadR family transcriptional regulator [Deltaproteobacteria bacterium]